MQAESGLRPHACWRNRARKSQLRTSTSKGAKRVAETIAAKAGKALAIAVDLGEEEQIQTMVRTTVEAFGHIDVLHNNAADLLPERFPRDRVHGRRSVGSHVSRECQGHNVVLQVHPASHAATRGRVHH